MLYFTLKTFCVGWWRAWDLTKEECYLCRDNFSALFLLSGSPLLSPPHLTQESLLAYSEEPPDGSVSFFQTNPKECGYLLMTKSCTKVVPT